MVSRGTRWPACEAASVAAREGWQIEIGCTRLYAAPWSARCSSFLEQLERRRCPAKLRRCSILPHRRRVPRHAAVRLRTTVSRLTLKQGLPDAEPMWPTGGLSASDVWI